MMHKLQHIILAFNASSFLHHTEQCYLLLNIKNYMFLFKSSQSSINSLVVYDTGLVV